MTHTLTVTIRCDANQLHRVLHPDATVRILSADSHHLHLENVSDAQGTATLEPETSPESRTPSSDSPGNLADSILDMLRADGPASTRVLAADLAAPTDDVRDACRALADGGEIVAAGNRGWQIPRATPVDHDAARARAAEGV